MNPAPSLFFAIACLTLTAFAQDPVLPELESLQKEYATLVTAADKPHLAAVAALDQKYIARLEQEQQAAQQSGKLDDALALDAEKKSISSGNHLPVMDDSKTLPVLKKMHAAYHAETAKLEFARANYLKPLRHDYIVELDALVMRLTKDGKLQEAMAAKKFRESLPAAADAPVAPTRDSNNTPAGKVMPIKLADKAMMKFCYCPPGSFQMGNAMTEDKDLSNAPIRTVTVSAFYMGQNLVTKADWDGVRKWGLANGYKDLAEGMSNGHNHPVLKISWYQAVKWCNALSEMEKLTPCYMLSGAVYRTTDSKEVVCNWSANGYRLPTEAEWEKAARGGLSGKRFPWGDTISHKEANFKNDGKEAYQTGTTGPHPTWGKGAGSYTSPVGSFPANGYGLYDMAGNVRQWCWDLYGSYAVGSQTDPHGSTSGSARVDRGGVWGYGAGYCRVAFRYGSGPAVSNGSFGFRVARSAVP